MTSPAELLRIARNEEAPLPERYGAYEEIVRRFQGLAYASAYATLGDTHLAEDAAQEAFVEAWRRLADLREPAAFPGWLRRIVLTQCHRLLRKRPNVVAYDLSAIMQRSGEDGRGMAEQLGLQEQVRAALESIPTHEREVVTLFYLQDYAQSDIATFLELPLTTVKKRLHSARNRLKERLFDLVEEGVRPAPLRDREHFVKVVQKMIKTVDGMELHDRRHEKISMTSLQGASLMGVDLRDASLTHVNFVGATLNHIYFAKVHVDGLQWGGTLFENIVRPDPRQGDPSAEPGTGKWVNADPVTFRNSDLSTARFERCNLSGVDIRDCDLTGMRIDGVSVEELLEAYRAQQGR